MRASAARSAKIGQDVADDAGAKQVGVAVQTVRQPGRAECASEDVGLRTRAKHDGSLAWVGKQAAVEQRPDLLGDESGLSVLVFGQEQPRHGSGRIVGTHWARIAHEIPQRVTELHQALGGPVVPVEGDHR